MMAKPIRVLESVYYPMIQFLKIYLNKEFFFFVKGSDRSAQLSSGTELNAVL